MPCPSRGSGPGFESLPQKEIVSLKQQLESELIVFGRSEPSIHQVIEPDEEPAGVGTQGGADDSAGEPAHKCAQDKRPDARARGLLNSRGFRFIRQTGNG